MYEVVEQGCYVVLVGSFNPSILSPHWMAREGIISQADADEADLDILHKDLCRFAIPGVKFDIVSDRCLIHAEAEPFIRLVDIIAAMFIERLPHTPIASLGINYYIHGDLGDLQKRFRFGRLVAPIEPWSDLSADFDSEIPEKIGGMVDLTMQISRPDEFEGVIRTTIQPSNRITTPTGVFVQVNDHFGPTVIENNNGVQDAKPAKSKKEKKASKLVTDPVVEPTDYAKLFADNFEISLARSRKIARGLLDKADKA